MDTSNSFEPFQSCHKAVPVLWVAAGFDATPLPVGRRWSALGIVVTVSLSLALWSGIAVLVMS